MNARRNAGFPVRICPVCDFVNPDAAFRQEFAQIEGVSFLEGYDVVSCARCGFVYAAGIPEQAEFDNYYINANKYELAIEQPDVITGRVEYIVEEIARLNIDPAAPVADIGCARSEILRSLRERGFSDLTGVDPSAKNVSYLRSKGINGIHAAINTMDTSRQYEAVFFLSVLEHIVDLRHTLDILYAITADNGVLVIEVPDMAAPAPGELPYQEFSREHINYFTSASLSNLMMRHGFHAIFQKNGHSQLAGFFRKTPREIRKDDGERHIRRYIELSGKYENEICANLQPYSGVPLIIWGLGTFTQRLLLKNVLKNIVALVDSNPQYAGKRYNDIEIITPAGLKTRREPILLAVSPRYVDAITHTIRNEMSLENEIIQLRAGSSFEYNHSA